MSLRRAALIGLALGLSSLGGGAAHGYVRSRTSHGTPTHWKANCVFVQPDSTGSPDLDPATTFTTIQTSIQAWRDATKSCAYLNLNYVDPAVLDAHFDGTNTIKFRTDKWCHPNDAQSQDVCYSSIAAGITTVYYVDRPGDSDDGIILDADVELNNIDFTFDFVDPMKGATKQARAGTTIADFENTLVHELGHLQGLDHTCNNGDAPANEVDENGTPPPRCDKLSTLSTAERLKITEATMFASAAPAETKKRSPEADDIAGICAAYPIASVPSQCVAADIGAYAKHGCAMGAPAPVAAPIALLVLLALAAIAARRRA
jgi:MYXO-CTERM domain-containing protein